MSAEPWHFAAVTVNAVGPEEGCGAGEVSAAK